MKQTIYFRGKKHKYPHAAFTIVELIITVAIVGILASVTAIGIGSWRTQVAETELKSDLANLKAGMEDARNRNNGYPTFLSGAEFDGTNDTKNIFTQSKHVRITYIRGNTKSYCINAQSRAVPAVQWYLDTAGGNTTPKSGTCA